MSKAEDMTMKKMLIISVLALAMLLSACSASDSSAPASVDAPAAGSNEQPAASTVEVETAEAPEEERGMDLSIYPSSNIANFEANGAPLFTYDQLFEKIQPLVAESGKEEFGGTEYYRDANGHDLLSVFYRNDEFSGAFFREYYENGIMKSEIYANGRGDTPAYQVQEWDSNGQIIRDSNIATRSGLEYMSNTIYDYHANGMPALENRYLDSTLYSSRTFNENGLESCYSSYEDGVEDYRRLSAYDSENKLLTEEEYSQGVLDYWKTYEYDAKGNTVKVNEYNQYIGADNAMRYTLFEYSDKGNLSKKYEYMLDEGLFLGYKGESAVEYNLYMEAEYYDNGNPKWEFFDDYEVMPNGEIADMYKLEYNKDYLTTGITFYDYQGNVLAEVKY